MTKLPSINVLTIDQSLDYILEHQASVARFGDGEIDLMMGHSIPYQSYDAKLVKQLRKILKIQSNPNFVVGLPDVFHGMERYNRSAQLFWASHFQRFGHFFEEECQSDWYVTTFISRPYIDFIDKSQSASHFSKLKQLWKDKDVLIVEGTSSRSGVGNDLFSEANSIQRIICPSHDAYSKYDSILDAIRKNAEGKLILLMLGPTAKVLSYQLSKEGHHSIDIGHIDSEYEWFKMNATHKIKLSHKHTAEFNYDENITFQDDEAYEKQIIVWIDDKKNEVSNLKKLAKEVDIRGKISIVVPVYNVENYLRRCLDSILKQSHEDFEVLLINDGSTDTSALICEEYAKKDNRIHVIHQNNSGPSVARNRGIDEAMGDYITFIDSDDFVDEEYLSNLLRILIENESDIAIANFASFNEDRHSFMFYISKESYFEKNYSPQEWLDQEGTSKNNLFLVVTLSPLKLFKKELFEGIRFPVGRVREDDATIYKLYLRAKQISFINEGTYFYSQRKDSLSHTVMQDDISTMISNAEERIALLAALGYDLSEHILSYVKRLYKCRDDALRAGQIGLFYDIQSKLDLIENYQKES